MSRLRHPASIVLLVLAGILLPIGATAAWAGNTIYDSTTFSNRAATLLDSATIRQEMAERLTEELARQGNAQAVNFRPAFQLAVDAVINTDTFRSIFRTAVRKLHQSLLSGEGGATGLDLSDSINIIASTLQLPGSAASGTALKAGGLGASLEDVTGKLDDYGFWDLDEIMTGVAVGGLLGALVCGIGAVALSTNRRRTVQWLGAAVVLDGLLLVLAVSGVAWFVRRSIDDAQLAAAVWSAVQRGMADLKTAGWWIAGYGLIVLAAAHRGRRLTPAYAYERVGGWVQRRHAGIGGKALLGGFGLLASIALVIDPGGFAKLLVVVMGLWIAYMAVTELLLIVTTSEVTAARTGKHWPKFVAAASVVVVLAGVVTGGLVLTSGRAAKQAVASGVQECNGTSGNCDLRLDEVLLPGTHNSMSSTLYPGWLFAEQVNTIKQQLDAGVRALLFDTHYGVQSSARMPGSESPIILTDRAAELATPPGEDIDPSIVARANELASKAPPEANADREIYLCHNFCEMGAVPFASVLGDIKTFLETNPDEVVMIIIQDATTPADTAKAIEDAGLAERAAVLTKGETLPTLRSLTDAGTNLVVFAEQGGDGAPPWYQQAYDGWVQETPFKFKDVDAFDCAPNRGTPDAPLFLVNHWVEASPPNPSKAQQANAEAVLGARLQQCAKERGLMPNIVAVDFAGRGDLLTTLRTEAGDLASLARSSEPLDVAPAPATAPPTATPTTSVAPAPTDEQLRPPTAIESLTGGRPADFCRAIPEALAVAEAWAYAEITAPPGSEGVADLLFAPALVRVLTPYVDAAPDEAAALARPLLVRAQAALGVLQQLGVDDETASGLADSVIEQVRASVGVDGVTEQTLGAPALPTVDRATLTEAGAEFTKGQPDPVTVADFGTVTDEVATAGGYDCIGAATPS